MTDFPSPWLTTEEACTYLRLTSKSRLRMLYRFLKNNGVPTARVGRLLRVARADLDRAMGVAHRQRKAS